MALQAPELLHYLHFGEEHVREFRASPTVGHFECSDGRWIMIVGIDQKFWPRIASALDLRHLIDDPKFARGFGRYTNRYELQEQLETAFASNTSAHWLERLREQDVPASLVQDYALLSQQEQPWANDYLVKRDYPGYGEQRIVGMHIQLSETPGEVGAPAPALGADTDAVLATIGLSSEELAELRHAGVTAPME
jgi:crotonobetainyl-CoA:carnitine CoA-transferase CaiB-like acyl-CoA transferase